jgi:hypothetical protein
MAGCPICDSWAWYVTLISDIDGNRVSLGCTTPECPGERILLISTEVTVH